MTALLDDAKPAAPPTPAARALHWLAVAYAAARHPLVRLQQSTLIALVGRPR